MNEEYKEINISGMIIIEEGYNDDENVKDIEAQIKRFIENISGVYIEEWNFE